MHTALNYACRNGRLDLAKCLHGLGALADPTLLRTEGAMWRLPLARYLVKTAKLALSSAVLECVRDFADNWATAGDGRGLLSDE